MQPLAGNPMNDITTLLENKIDRSNKGIDTEFSLDDIINPKKTKSSGSGIGKQLTKIAKGPEKKIKKAYENSMRMADGMDWNQLTQVRSRCSNILQKLSDSHKFKKTTELNTLRTQLTDLYSIINKEQEKRTSQTKELLQPLHHLSLRDIINNPVLNEQFAHFLEQQNIPAGIEKQVRKEFKEHPPAGNDFEQAVKVEIFNRIKASAQKRAYQHPTGENPEEILRSITKFDPQTKNIQCNISKLDEPQTSLIHKIFLNFLEEELLHGKVNIGALKEYEKLDSDLNFTISILNMRITNFKDTDPHVEYFVEIISYLKSHPEKITSSLLDRKMQVLIDLAKNSKLEAVKTAAVEFEKSYRTAQLEQVMLQHFESLFVPPSPLNADRMDFPRLLYTYGITLSTKQLFRTLLKSLQQHENDPAIQKTIIAFISHWLESEMYLGELAKPEVAESIQQIIQWGRNQSNLSKHYELLGEELEKMSHKAQYPKINSKNLSQQDIKALSEQELSKAKSGKWETKDVDYILKQLDTLCIEALDSVDLMELLTKNLSKAEMTPIFSKSSSTVNNITNYFIQQLLEEPNLEKRKSWPTLFLL